jgi:hypothetical protein
VKLLLHGVNHHHLQQGLPYTLTRPDDYVGAVSRILGALWTEELTVSRIISLFSVKFSDSYVGKNYTALTLDV